MHFARSVPRSSLQLSKRAAAIVGSAAAMRMLAPRIFMRMGAWGTTLFQGTHGRNFVQNIPFYIGSFTVSSPRAIDLRYAKG